MIHTTVVVSAKHIYRAVRETAYKAIEPLDFLVRVINGKKDFPPVYLRRYVGPLREFEKSGAEFLAYLKLLCYLQSDEKILDIGSGCGLMALYLLDHLGKEGTYDGVEIHKPSVTWCEKHITKNHHQFIFTHIDVKNSLYNPDGQYEAQEFAFPFPDGLFDVILLKSVFTHMRPAETENYLKEISRLLSEKGRCLATFFLLNPRQEELAQNGLNTLEFKFGDETWRYMRKSSPESAIAYNEVSLINIITRYSLNVKKKIYGTWSGLHDGLSYQDILILEKQ
jgi:SAM-dependent methyltransferase